MSRAQLCGIFVGGAASRMGGRAKGLLPSPETQEPLVARLARIIRELGAEPVLVGKATLYSAALPDLPTLDDRPAGIGPLGGLYALLCSGSPGQVLALACDLPLLSPALIERLLHEPLRAPDSVLAPRSNNGLWEPLCARYDAATAKLPVEQAIARGVRSFQKLFTELHVSELTVSSAERAELVDWDTPEDVTRTACLLAPPK
jgi:molybdopterin-guanine dinucleotide biosynthesis protein A